jgi:hypothetical protein
VARSGPIISSGAIAAHDEPARRCSDTTGARAGGSPRYVLFMRSGAKILFRQYRSKGMPEVASTDRTSHSKLDPYTKAVPGSAIIGPWNPAARP